MANILVICEQSGGVLKKTAGELLGKAAELAAGGSVSALVTGAGASAAAAAAGGWGATTGYAVDADLSTSDALADAFHAAVVAAGATVVLAPASAYVREAFPRLAVRVGGDLITDCVGLQVGGAEIVATRPLYAGKCLAGVSTSADVKLFSVRPNSFDAAPAGDGTATVAALDVSFGNSGVQVVEVTQSESNEVDLMDADRVVSGGRSLKSAENFELLRTCAAAIGAGVGASRAAVDAGMAPHSMQVGQTGKTVNPTLYIAAGISGAIQHLAGMRTSKVIVAVNTDADAPIFQHSTYGVEHDLFEFMPALQAELEKHMAGQ